jgi:hypothetical protein
VWHGGGAQLAGMVVLVASAAGYVLGAKYLRSTAAFADALKGDYARTAVRTRTAPAAQEIRPLPVHAIDEELPTASLTDIPLAAAAAAHPFDHFHLRTAAFPHDAPSHIPFPPPKNEPDDEEFFDDARART